MDSISPNRFEIVSQTQCTLDSPSFQEASKLSTVVGNDRTCRSIRRFFDARCFLTFAPGLSHRERLYSPCLRQGDLELRPDGDPVRVDFILGSLSVHVRAIVGGTAVTHAVEIVSIEVAERSISGSRRVAEVLSLQEHRDLSEGRPLVLLPSPALEHQVVDVLRARRGTR